MYYVIFNYTILIHNITIDNRIRYTEFVTFLIVYGVATFSLQREMIGEFLQGLCFLKMIYIFNQSLYFLKYLAARQIIFF